MAVMPKLVMTVGSLGSEFFLLSQEMKSLGIALRQAIAPLKIRSQRYDHLAGSLSNSDSEGTAALRN